MKANGGICLTLRNPGRLWTLVAACLLCLLTLAGGQLSAANFTLAEGTAIKVSFDSKQPITSGNYRIGDELTILLEEPVTKSGEVLVKAGAKGTAKVVEAIPSSRAGKPGFIRIEFVSLEPSGSYSVAGGGKILLSGGFSKTGKGKKLLSYLLIFGLFIKGGQGEIAPGSVFEATISETVVLQSK